IIKVKRSAAPRAFTRRRGLFSRLRRPHVEATMPSIDFAALSFLPLAWRREVAERLRAGDHPRDVLAGCLASHSPDPELTDEALLGRAAAALTRAEKTGVQMIDWSSTAYPPSLAAIIEPPPVLWVRGNPAALEPPAVAIVGSRAGSPYAIAVAESLAADVAA